MSDQATLVVQLDGADSDAEELAGLTAKLRRELLQLDVDAVEQARGEAPPEGAKAVEVLVIGTLLVHLGRTAGKLADVVRAVQGWIRPQSQRTVKLQLDGDAIEITGASSSEQERLIELWIQRHSDPP